MKQNLSDEILYSVLGAELTESDMINSKIEEAYTIIRKQNKSNKKRKKSKVFIGIGSVAALMLLSFTFCVMNPVMASELPIVGSLFAKVADIFPFGRIPEENTAALYHGEENSSYQVQDGDITVTLTEEYASNQGFYIGIRIENAKEFPEMAAYVESGVQWLDIRTKEAYSFRSEPIMTRRRIEGKFEDEHTFIGIMRIDYSEISVDASRYHQAIDEADAKGEAYPELNNLTRDEWLDYYAIPDSFDMALEITTIVGTLKNPTRPEGMKSDEELEQMTDAGKAEYRNSLPREWVGFPNRYQHWYCDGTWSFEVPVIQRDEAARIIEVNEVNEAGLGIESIELSSVEMTLNTIEKTMEPMMEIVFDADGREISYGYNNGVYIIAGHDISTVSVYICRWEDWEQAVITSENPENGKSFYELIKECALFETNLKL